VFSQLRAYVARQRLPHAKPILWPDCPNLMPCVFLFSLVKGLLRGWVPSLAPPQARPGQCRCARRSGGSGQGWLPNWLPSAPGGAPSPRASGQTLVHFPGQADERSARMFDSGLAQAGRCHRRQASTVAVPDSCCAALTGCLRLATGQTAGGAASGTGVPPWPWPNRDPVLITVWARLWPAFVAKEPAGHPTA
jgi:hypothetical protein